MTNALIPILLAGTVMVCSQAHSAQNYVLVENGKAKCAIVLPKDYSAPMEYGAKDLSKHLQLMSGAEVTIYKQTAEDDIPNGYEGLIELSSKRETGDAAVGGEEFYITTKPGRPWTIRIYGDNRRGVLYGCYGLLQDVLGCRWYTKSISEIPKKKTISVGALNIHQKPSFELRDPYYYEALVDTEWAVRNRVNGSQCRLDESVGGKVIYGTFIAHTFFSLVPPEKYFATHPEYFSLVRGKRVDNAQLCLTNPDTLRTCVESIKERISNSPNANIFSVSQMDMEGGACQCENCRKIVEEEGSESGPILRFVNAVAKEINKEHPDILIETLAYNYSQKPPKHTRPLPNVRIRLCIPWTCKAHRLDDICSKDSYQDLLNWSKITNQLYIWDYNTEFNDYMLLHPSLKYTKTVYDIFNKTGVVGVFMLGSYTSYGGSLSEIKTYLSARLMWDHALDPDKLLDEYVKKVYGKAAPVIMQWIALIHSPFKQNTGQKMMGIYDLASAAYLTKEILDKSDKLIEKAEALCVDDPVALNEVGKVRMWVDYTRIAQIKPKLEVNDGKYSYGVSNTDLDRIDRWMQSIKSYGVTNVSEGRAVDVSDLLTHENASVDCVTLENNRLRLDIVPSLGGKIVRLINKSNNRNLLVPPKSVFQKVEGGYEEYIIPQARGSEFLDINYDAKTGNDVVTLTGVTPLGKEITREFALQDNKLIITTSVKNTGDKPADVQIWGRPQLSIKDFEEISVIFDQANGEKINLGAKDFSINWAELSKKYKGNEIPAGKVILKLRNAALDIQFDPNQLEMLDVFNNGGLPNELISPELHAKPVTLGPGESTSFQQTWTIEAP